LAQLNATLDDLAERRADLAGRMQSRLEAAAQSVPGGSSVWIYMHMHTHWNARRALARSAFALASLAAMTVGGIGMPVAAQDSSAELAARDDAQLGSILTDAKGMTVYLYAKDDIGVTNCYDQCATAWPPLLTVGEPILPVGMPGVLGTTPRKEGTTQVTYNGMPLYYWFRDAKPGDTTGQNVGGVWFVLNPAPAPTVNVRGDAELGDILTDARGMTLYLYTRDSKNVSNCYDQCVTAWPPLLATDTPSGPDSVSAGLGLTTRQDGSRQVTYQGQPLYYWVRDTAPGDTTGQNVGGVWFVLNP
jgi:predicted lipoprotein with Yx(FWY)xxD motif